MWYNKKKLNIRNLKNKNKHLVYQIFGYKHVISSIWEQSWLLFEALCLTGKQKRQNLQVMLHVTKS